MSLKTMLEKVIWVQNSTLPQQTKDKAKQIMNETLDFVLKETPEQRINQLVYEEYRRKRLEKTS